MLRSERVTKSAKRGFLGMVFLVGIITALGSLHYVLGDPNHFSWPFLPKYQRHLALVRTHGVAAALTLILGPLQFLPKLGFHRQRGQIYLWGVLVGTATGIPMSLMAEGGRSSQAGFLVMSLLWGFTGFQAYRTIRQRRILEHRTWVIRNFALALGAVTLRIYLHLMQGWGWRFDDIYPSAVWVCWVPVLILAEFWIPKSPEQ